MKVLAWIGTVVVALPLVFALTLVSALSEAYAFVHLYAWFVVPVFHLPTFGYWQAAGFSLLVAVISSHADSATEVKGSELYVRLGRSLVRPWMCLAFGYVFYLWSAA